MFKPSLVKSGMQKVGQDLSQGMDELMGYMLCSGTQQEDRKKPGAGVDDQPEPQHACRAAEPGTQFIQVEVWEPLSAWRDQDGTSTGHTTAREKT